ncbi:trypsin-like serine peptidase (plasmid) [Rhizobium leguminosarum]
MQLTSDELENFAAICAQDVAPSRMEREVRKFNVIPNFESFVKEKSTGQANPVLALYWAYLEELNRHGLACDLAEALFFDILWSGNNKETVATYTRSARMPNAQPENLQALLKSRDHFITDEGLFELFSKVRPTVGIVVGTFLDNHGVEVSTRATAFLVGPDLILTALHTFAPLLDANGGKDVPKSFKAVFDFYAGEPITGTADLDNLRQGRVVSLFPDETAWLVAHSREVTWAGTVAVLGPTQCMQLKSNLDFALVKLGEPIGTLSKGGGSREPRGWLSVSMPSATAYAVENQVIMPQHPQGMSLRHAIGRIRGPWDPATRVIYDLEAEKGSSGAPCLNSKMQLIGLHSAAFRPGGQAIGNLAVRIDVIHPLVANLLPIAPVRPAAKSIWRVVRANQPPAPVLGREKLQTWLDRALSPSPSARSRSDRIYVADAPQAGAGKTFTTEIVRAFLMSGQKQNVIILGGDTELMPERLEDFVTVLAAGFGLSKDDLGPLPPRPGANLPKEAKDGDKLDRWESQDMPEWFIRQLAAYRTVMVNKTAALKRIVDDNDALGRPNTPEDRAAANADPPEILVSLKWTRTWILLDDLDRRPLSAEVRKFVAGLVGSDIDESAVTDLRADLQWLFLGVTPEFLLASDMTVENFSPADVKVEHIAATFQAAFDEAGIQRDSNTLATAVLLFMPKALRDEHVKGNLGQTPLSVCQQLTADLISGTYKEFGRTL